MYLKKLLVIFSILLCSTLCIAQEPSTDKNNPAIMTSNTVEGEYDGLETAHFYTFTANKGEVEVIVTAQTEKYSLLVDAELLDQTGRQLLLVNVVAKEQPQTESRTVKIIHKQPVILRVFLRKDNDIKHLNYKVQIQGAAEFQPAATSGQMMNTPPPTPPEMGGKTPETSKTPSQMMNTPPATPSGMMGTPETSDVRSCLPQSGTLTITTASGKTFQVDLKDVVQATVKQ